MNAVTRQSAVRKASARPTPAQAQTLVKLAQTHASLHLNPTKLDFLSQRLGKRLRAHGFDNFDSYIRLLSTPQGAAERQPFVEALTTHTTRFFREQAHFDWLAQTGWADLIADGAGRDWPFTIWSAACSSGQELYSAMMCLADHEARHGVSLRKEGVGTDISQEILRTAEMAIYSRAGLEGLGDTHRRRWILRARDGSDRYRIAPELRRQTRWMPANLSALGRSGPAKADLIFLRNVLIYFDHETQSRVIASLAARLRPGGILMTGHSETLSLLPPALVSVKTAIYRRKDMTDA